MGEEDPFLLLFTSGTTGRPKGVRLPQRSIVHAIDGGRMAVGTTEADQGLHFLPFAHVAGHDQFMLALAQGHALLMIARREDTDRRWRSGRPTCSRCRWSTSASAWRWRRSRIDGLSAPLRRLVRAGLARRGAGPASTAPAAPATAPGMRLADRLVGKAVREKLGGQVRGLFAGGAPATPALFRFFEALGIPFVELYGMSETAGLISSNLFEGPRGAGSAGLPTPDHRLRFAPDGELLLQGPLLLTGYLDEEDTRGPSPTTASSGPATWPASTRRGRSAWRGARSTSWCSPPARSSRPSPSRRPSPRRGRSRARCWLARGGPSSPRPCSSAARSSPGSTAQGLDAAEALLPRARAALSAFSEYEKPKRLVVIPGAPQDHPALITPTLKLKREALLESIRQSVAAVYAGA